MVVTAVSERDTSCTTGDDRGISHDGEDEDENADNKGVYREVYGRSRNKTELLRQKQRTTIAMLLARLVDWRQREMVRYRKRESARKG